MKRFAFHVSSGLAAAVAVCIANGAAAANDFYRGKTVTVVVGYAAGGGVDTTARAVTRHLGRFIPGNPHIVVQNMEGAGGQRAVFHLAQRAAPDGLTLGVPGRSWVVEGIAERSGKFFNPAKLTFLGSPGPVISVVYLRAALGIKTYEELKSSKKTITIGGLSAGSHTATVPMLLAANGAPLKVLVGYVSTARSLLALEQGEIDGCFTTGEGMAGRKDLADQVVPLAQSGPRHPGVPLLHAVIRPSQHALLDLMMAPDTQGVPLVGPPELPPDVTAILRKAFLDMAQDKAYQTDAAKVGLPVGEPIEGAKLAVMVQSLASSATPEVIAEFWKLSSGK